MDCRPLEQDGMTIGRVPEGIIRANRVNHSGGLGDLLLLWVIRAHILASSCLLLLLGLGSSPAPRVSTRGSGSRGPTHTSRTVRNSRYSKRKSKESKKTLLCRVSCRVCRVFVGFVCKHSPGFGECLRLFLRKSLSHRVLRTNPIPNCGVVLVFSLSLFFSY